MIIDPKVGQTVVSLSFECCDGLDEGEEGVIVKIETQDKILVRPKEDINDDQAMWMCPLCLESL